MSQPSPAELEARLRLHLLPQLGPRRFFSLIAAFGDASAALSAPAAAWRALGLPAESAEARRSSEVRRQVSATMAWLEVPDQHLMMWDAPDYPGLLSELPDAPPMLFVAGDPALLWHPAVALVGSRAPTTGGRDNAGDFARTLAASGWCVASGLAAGIDTAAHTAALEAGGLTLAVLGVLARPFEDQPDVPEYMLPPRPEQVVRATGGPGQTPVRMQMRQRQTCARPWRSGPMAVERTARNWETGSRGGKQGRR